MLNDDNINGTDYILKTYIELFRFEKAEGTDIVPDIVSEEFFAAVSTCNEDYFKYLLFSKKYNDTDSSDPFFVPVNIYSNFSNGLGIFAGFNEKVRIKRFTKLIGLRN